MATSKQAKHPFIESTPKNFSIGNAIKPKKDLTAIVRWPKCVQLQRKRAILLRKVKMPPALYQFHVTLDRMEAAQLFKFLLPYRPESTQEKKARILEEAENRMKGAEPKIAKKNTLVYGLDEVTKLVESKTAKLVVIAHDVHPVELVCWLPALCRRMQVPYCIIKGKARLGALVHKKNAAAVALKDVNSGDVSALSSLVASYESRFIANAEARKKWGF
ncbi:uncharacterized protein LOC142597905 [Dermatophagoides farinae]|uniref:uncharacterized protein LOC142597905 n=1 Tax=Dermatophagoides farinae TaxID=6954 RepID=UPI003F607D4F